LRDDLSKQKEEFILKSRKMQEQHDNQIWHAVVKVKQKRTQEILANAKEVQTDK
jgi:hypothetical protein